MSTQTSRVQVSLWPELKEHLLDLVAKYYNGPSDFSHDREEGEEEKGPLPFVICPVCRNEIQLMGIAPHDQEPLYRTEIICIAPCNHMFCQACWVALAEYADIDDVEDSPCPLCKRWMYRPACGHADLASRLPSSCSRRKTDNVNGSLDGLPPDLGHASPQVSASCLLDYISRAEIGKSGDFAIPEECWTCDVRRALRFWADCRTTEAVITGQEQGATESDGDSGGKSSESSKSSES